MPRYISAFAIAPACLAAVAVAQTASAANVDFPRFPAIAPDASAITFSWRGDIFLAPLDPGGATLNATRLTNHPLDELYSTFSPDGQHVLFTSEQFGADNVFRIDRDGSDPTPLTRTDRTFIISDHHPTRPAVLGHAFREGDVYRAARPYAASTDNGRIERLHDAFGNLPAASPDGSRIAFERGGSSWDRRHYRGPDNRDLFLHDTQDRSFHRLTNWNGNDGLPRFATNDTLLFLSDRELDTVNIYRADITDDNTLDQRSIRRVTNFDGKDVQWFDVDADGRTVVLHVWDTLYTLDLRSNRPPRALTIAAPSDLRDDLTLEDLADSTSDAALSPDGNTMAFIARGELFIRSTEDENAPTRRVTTRPNGTDNPDILNNGHARERSPAWSPDGLRLYFTSDADGSKSIYQATVHTTRSELKDRVLEVVNPDALERERQQRDASDRASTDANTDNGGTTSFEHPAQGRWQGTAQTDGIPNMPANLPITLSITADADGNLAATINAIGSTLTPESVTWSPPNLELSVRWADGSVISLTGTINNDTINGTWSSGAASGEWSATRNATFPEPANQQIPSEDANTENNQEDDPEADKDLEPRLDPERWHDAVRFNIAPVVQTMHDDMQPRPLPDGRRISFRRNLGDIVIRDLITDEERTLFESWDTNTDWRFTHDARYTVFSTYDLDFNADIHIVETDGPTDAIPEPINLSMHPDNDFQPRISADGKVLAFISERAGEQYDVYAVYLDADLDDLPTEDLDAYFKRAEENAGKIKPIDPVDLATLREQHRNPTPDDDANNEPNDNDNNNDTELAAADSATDEEQDDHTPAVTSDTLETEDLEDAYLRVRRITNYDGFETNLELTPAGDRFVFTGSPNGDRALYSLDRDGGDRKKLGPAANVVDFSPTNNKAVIVQNNTGGTADPNGATETFPIEHTLRVDLKQQASQKFTEAARTLGKQFYHPTMKDLDWAELTDRYHALATQTRTADEFAHVASRFLGELNASHLGVFPPAPSSDIAQPAGRLGIDTTTLAQPDGTVHYRVNRVIFDAPAADTDMALKPNDTITAIELEPITHSLEASLAGRVDQETIITVQREADNQDDQTNPATLDLLITPISWRDERERRYTDWTLSRRQRVEQQSGARLGYLHIRSMGAGSLDDFERDLFAAAYGKDGLIIDVRNNPGGWITDRLLASIMARPHAYTIPRGGDTHHTEGYPQDRLYIQRYTKPINLLINEKSFSNAEIFAHAFNALDRGTTVGVQTYGGVISTGGFSLIDGTRVRLPFRGWFLEDGTDMENNGAKPDIRVPQTPQAEAAGDDEQLETAVRNLLDRLDTKTANR